MDYMLSNTVQCATFEIISSARDNRDTLTYFLPHYTEH